MSDAMSGLGANLGFVDEMYARFREDPTAVSEAWREFFADYQPPPGQAARIEAATAVEAPAPVVPEVPAPATEPELPATPLRGAAARIVKNMEASLEVPTATSARTVPVKLLDENRRLINQHQLATSAPKISFTHIIAWAIVRALDRHGSLNSAYLVRDGQPHVRTHDHINLGLAVDVEKRGERLLVVPSIKAAQTLNFPDFVSAYDSLALKARQNKLQLDDLQGTTVTLTNPGTIGTALSVPRLMVGQGAIIGVGRIDYPPEYSGMAPRVISELGLSKVMTVTSTYDHRIIQGAESGAFLATLERFLLGADDFYVQIFRELQMPYEPLESALDQHPGLASGGGSSEAIAKQASVLQLIRAHRVRGHLLADLDPLGYNPKPQPELELPTYGLSVWDLDREFVAGGLGGRQGMRTLREILDTLRATYCRHVGVEYMHIPEQATRSWMQERVERTPQPLSDSARQRILDKLNAAEAFERFLHTTYIGQKRFSLEGAEVLIPMLDALFNAAVEAGIGEAIIGMAHRGRLNVLANTIGKSYGAIFREFEGELDPDLSHGSGDVKYHLGAGGTHEAPDGGTLRLTLASNPSHLEAVDPVVEGMARARQDKLEPQGREVVLPVLIHGDAAFAGQGVVAETLNLSLLHGYRTGGTVHIVVNNQIGFTTSAEHLRSSLYATDVAKAVKAPILHVNADEPEEVVRVIQLALEFRLAFARDVVVDLVCYRRWGHNEGDDPSYTNPTMYAQIKTQRSVRKLYTEQLLRRGYLQPDAAEEALEDFHRRLATVHDEVKAAQAAAVAGRPLAPERAQDGGPPTPGTAVEAARLVAVLDGLERLPDDFEPHPKLVTQLARRRTRYDDDSIDWALAETLAFGTLALDGVPVRLSGEDSGRGTFSQRHASLYDHRDGRLHIPLQHLSPEQAPFNVYDSHLSEFGVLGFEYGYSVNAPEALVMWEAQFGDFVNGAQVIIDQFISSAEDKWGQQAGVTMLLPHGYEGQGPEHSSARIERFLQLGAGDNLRVAYPSDPAQYFHLLRRQALHRIKRPLIVFTPKSLLRLPECVSAASSFTDGRFEAAIDDRAGLDAAKVRRVVLCSGKVYWDLDAHRRAEGIDDVALLRLELLYPFPAERVAGLLRHYSAARGVHWVQEEPANMGPWSFVRPRIEAALPAGLQLGYVGRPESPSPATGSGTRHTREQQALVRDAFA